MPTLLPACRNFVADGRLGFLVSEKLSISGATSPEPLATRKNVGGMVWMTLILAVLYVCYFSQLGVLGFVGPDEPRYAWIARAMAETGDWVTPRLYGQAWFEKPVLYYWGATASFKLLGVSEAAARLPSAVSALLGTLAVGWLAWRVYGAATARWVLILLPTSIGMIGFSHAAATDMPFAGMLTIAMACAAVCLGLTRDEHTPILPRTPWLALILFGLFLGLAVLAKGPAAIILCGGAIFFWAIFTKRWRDAFWLLHPAAILAFCATALPWYILCARRNADFFHVFIVEHNFRRYLTPEFQHGQPWWFYVPVLLVAFLPWTATLVWAAVVGTREYARTRRMGDAAWFFVCWAGFCVLFFSTSHSKLPGYILPALPAVAVLLARVYVSLTQSPSNVQEHRDALRIFRWVQVVGAVTFFGLFGLAALFATMPKTFAPLAGAARAVFVLFGLANLILAVFGAGKNNSRERFAAFACVPVLVATLAAGWVARQFFPLDPSGRTMARELAAVRVPGNQLFVAGMNRSLRYGVSFYLHSEVRDWGAGTETGGYLLSSAKNCERVVGAGFYCEEQAFDAERKTGRFLYLVIPIAGARR
jgi:4-amino-4-deoxy-L-arabinose transferase-like glycosyltransferase